MKLNSRSKKLAYILRHSPEEYRLTLDKEGWVLVSNLLANTDFTLAELDRICTSDTKRRYTLSHDKLHIRANQGHSNQDVDINFEVAQPPPILFHGTTESAYSHIRTGGLLPMSRQYVHLSNDVSTAHSVGARRNDETIILQIDTASMSESKYQFFKSTNGVWLTKHVPAMYISKVQTNQQLTPYI